MTFSLTFLQVILSLSTSWRVLKYIITTLTDRPVRLTEILVIMSVLTFKTAIILYIHSTLKIFYYKYKKKNVFVSFRTIHVYNQPNCFIVQNKIKIYVCLPIIWTLFLWSPRAILSVSTNWLWYRKWLVNVMSITSCCYW